MDHFITLPTDENGILREVTAVRENILPVTSAPFEFEDVFIFSHGWWTTANDAMLQYSTFSVGFTKMLCGLPSSLGINTPRSTLCIGIHWPSAFSEDRWQVDLVKILQGSTYWTMESRADSVGQSAVFALIYTIFENRFRQNNRRCEEGKDPIPLRMNLIGHSFGCRVISSALNRYYRKTVAKRADDLFKKFVQETRINLILLQAAQDFDFFDPGKKWEFVPKFDGARLLVTRSAEDTALTKWYNYAEGHNNILGELFGESKRFALGDRGMIDTEVSKSLGLKTVAVDSAFTHSQVPKFESARILEADLSALHRRENAVRDKASGTHSDIYVDEVYQLIAGFAFQE